MKSPEYNFSVEDRMVNISMKKGRTPIHHLNSAKICFAADQKIHNRFKTSIPFNDTGIEMGKLLGQVRGLLETLQHNQLEGGINIAANLEEIEITGDITYYQNRERNFIDKVVREIHSTLENVQSLNRPFRMLFEFEQFIEFKESDLQLRLV